MSGCSYIEERDPYSQQEEVTRDPKIPEGYTREPVNSKHVGYYLGKEAQDICNEIGKTQSNYENFKNKYNFIVTNGENSIKVELKCTHAYSYRVFLSDQYAGKIETYPTVWVMSKKYNDKNHVQSLKVVERVDKEVD